MSRRSSDSQSGERRKRGPSERRTIGRHAKCDIVLKRGKVSRRHCKLIPVDGGYLLRDLDSHNGTWVDGQRIDEVMVRPGDRFNVGNVTLEIADDGTVNEYVEFTGAKRHLNEERRAKEAAAEAERMTGQATAEPELVIEEPPVDAEARAIATAPTVLPGAMPFVREDERSDGPPPLPGRSPRSDSSPSSTADELLEFGDLPTPDSSRRRDEDHDPFDRDDEVDHDTDPELEPIVVRESPAPSGGRDESTPRSTAPTFERPNDRWRIAAVFLLLGGLAGYWIAEWPGRSSSSTAREDGKPNREIRPVRFDRASGGGLENIDPIVTPGATGDPRSVPYQIGPWDPVSLPLRPLPIAIPSDTDPPPVGRRDSFGTGGSRPSTGEETNDSEERSVAESIPRPERPEPRGRVSVGPSELHGPLVTEEELVWYAEDLLALALPLLDRYAVEAYSYDPLLPVLDDFRWLDSPPAVDALLALRGANLDIDERLVKRIRRLSSNSVARSKKPVEKELAFHLFTLLKKQLGTVRKTTDAIEGSLFALRRGDTVAYALETVLSGRDRELKLRWVEHAGERAEVATIPVLIDRLGVTNYTLKKAIRRSLESITGLDLGSKRKDWQVWWDSKQKEDDRDS